MSQAVEIEFKDPPLGVNGANQGIWIERLDPLIDHPGRWAVVHRTQTANAAYAAAAALRAGRLAAPPGRWTFRGATDGTGGAVYVRYDGPE